MISLRYIKLHTLYMQLLLIILLPINPMAHPSRRIIITMPASELNIKVKINESDSNDDSESQSIDINAITIDNGAVDNIAMRVRFNNCVKSRT